MKDKERTIKFVHHFLFSFKINQSVLNNVPQCPTLLNIDSPITFEELNAAIYELKNGKSPGLNNISLEAFKAMNGKMR